MRIIRNSAFLLGVEAGAVLAARAAAQRPKRKYSLAGKNVLITGGSRGLGLILAREFFKQGARVALCARNVAELERAKLDLATVARGRAHGRLRRHVEGRSR